MGCTHEIQQGAVTTVVNAGGLFGGCSFCKQEAQEAELGALHKVVRAAIDMRQKFGDEYEGRFAELDAALDAWAARYNGSVTQSESEGEDG